MLANPESDAIIAFLYLLVLLCVCNGVELPSGSMVKNPPPHAEDTGSVLGSGRSPGGDNDNPKNRIEVCTYILDIKLVVNIDFG